VAYKVVQNSKFLTVLYGIFGNSMPTYQKLFRFMSL